MPGSLNDQMKAFFDSVVDGTGSLSGGIASTLPAVQQSNSYTDTTSVTSPGAGAVIATVTPPAGTYSVEINTFIGGTTAPAVEMTNMRLTVGGVAIGRVMNAVPGTTGAVGVTSTHSRVITNGSQAISVIAVGAGTPGSVYAANIVASRLA